MRRTGRSSHRRHRGQVLGDRVEKLVDASSVLGRDGLWIAETEAKELEGELRLLRPVDLVDHADDRLAALGKQPRNLHIGRRHARAAVDDEHDDTSLCNGAQALLAHAALKLRFAFDLEAAGVDHGELPPGPFRVREQPVAGHPGLVVHERLAASDDAVEERRLADVRPADDGDRRERCAGLAHSPSSSRIRGLLVQSRRTLTKSSR